MLLLLLLLLLGMVIAWDRATTVEVVGLASWTWVTRNREMEFVGELLVDEGDGETGDSDLDAALSWTRDT